MGMCFSFGVGTGEKKPIVMRCSFIRNESMIEESIGKKIGVKSSLGGVVANIRFARSMKTGFEGVCVTYE